MAASAGTVTLDLDANSVKLLRELQKASRKTQTTGQKMQRHMTRAFAGIARAATRIGPALAVGLTGLAAAGVRSADSLAKTATKLGIAADELAGLQFAAQQTGVKVEALNMGLQRMVRRVAEAAVGTGEAKAALEELGLNAKALAQQSPDEQFRQIAEAMEQVDGEAHKVRLSFKLFDSEGVALKNTLAAGRQGLEAFSAEAERLGLAMTPKQLEMIQEAADAQGRVAAATKGLSQQLAASLAPAFIQVTNAAVTFISTITSSVADLAAYGAELLGIERTLESLALKDLEAEAKAVANQLKDTFAELDRKRRFWGDIKQGEKDIRSTEKALLSLQRRYADIQNQIADVRESETAAPAETLLPAIVEPVAVEATKTAARDVVAELLRQYETAEERVARLRNELLPLRDVDVERYNKIYAQLGETLNDGIEEIATGPILALKRVTEEATEEISEYAKQAARNMQDAFADFLFDPFDDGLKGMLQGFLDTIRRMLANQAALEIFGMLGGGGGFLGKLFGRASGGPVSAGTPYMVGERGPELFMPGQSGTIVPNHRLATAGGNVFNFTTNVSSRGGLDAPTLIPILEENNRKVKAEFLNELDRGKYS